MDNKNQNYSRASNGYPRLAAIAFVSQSSKPHKKERVLPSLHPKIIGDLKVNNFS